MRPRSFCDTRSIRSNCFPGAGLIRSHRCKRRRCTDGGCRRPCPPCRSLALWRRKRRIRPGAPQRLPARRCAIRPLGNDHHDLKGIEDGEQGERSPRAGATRHPSPPFSAHQPSDRSGKAALFPRKTVCIPPDGHPLSSARRACLTSFPHSQSSPAVPGTTRDPTGKIAEGRSCRWGIGQASHTKKTPSR